MNYRSGLLAVSLLAFAPSYSALAQDPAEPTDWSGLSFGFALATPRDGNFWREASSGLALESDAWEGSAMVLSLGRDWQRGNLTYGAQVSYGDGSYTSEPGDAVFISCAGCATEASDVLTLTGRVGFATGQTHIFANGGLARANVVATNTFGLQLLADTAMTGWTIGVGVEQRIGDGLSLAVSYDRVDLGTLPLPVYLPTGETDVTFGRMQVGMNVRW
jgi:opacity protein-like surface antigen